MAVESTSNPILTASSAVARAKPLAVLGDFELRAEIGRGGMGTVYEAWQRSLSRRVAIKVLGSNVAVSANAVLRFQREAQAAAKLSHPHILPIFAQGQQDGVYYYAMELVPGPGLNMLIAQARERSSSDTAIAPEVADTVALSQVEPEASTTLAETVIIRQSGPLGASAGPSDSSIVLLPPGEVHTSDEHFRLVAKHIASIADALEYAHKRGVIHRDIKPHNLLFAADGRLAVSDFGLARLVEEPGVTLTGEFLGSPLYMSIEQISHGSTGVDHRTDIYSLGATMYEWLTLRPPFPGESREQVISRVLHSEAAAPRELNPAIPKDLETICLKAIDKDRTRRYQSAAEMRDDLYSFLGSTPIRARRTPPLLRLRKFIGRHQMATVVLSALALALLLGEELVRSKSTVRNQATALKREQEETAQVLDMLRTLSPETKGVAWTLETVAPVVQDVIRRGPQAGSAAEALFAGGPNAASAGTAVGLARRAAEALYTATSDEGGESAGSTAEVEQRLLAQAEAETDARMQADLIGRVLEMNPRNTSALRLGLWTCCVNRDYAHMLSHAESLAAIRDGDASALLWRGLAGMLMDSREKALADLNRAVELDKLSPWSRTMRGIAYLHAGRADDAMLDLSTAVSISPELGVAWLARAAANAAMSRYERAADDVTQALVLQPKDADALAIRGEYRSAMGRYSDAAGDFDEAMKIGGRNAVIMLQLMLTKSKIGEPPTTGTNVNLGDTPAEANAADDADRSSSASSWGILDRIFGTDKPAEDTRSRRSRFDYPAATF